MLNNNVFDSSIVASQMLTDLYMIANTSPVPSIAQRWMGAWNAKDPDAMRAVFTPDGRYEDLAFKISAKGPRGVATWVQISIDHIPDLRGEILDAFQAGEQVSVRWTFSGTPRMLGPVRGTGKSYSLTVFSILELNGDKIVRVADCYNLADLLQQIDIPLSDFPLNASWREL
jgi:steroid delta-isomerase-like uncharacterized protein